MFVFFLLFFVVCLCNKRKYEKKKQNGIFRSGLRVVCLLFVKGDRKTVKKITIM